MPPMDIPPTNRCLLGLPLRFLDGDSDPVPALSAIVDDESRDSEDVDEMPNIGLKGLLGVVFVLGLSGSSCRAAAIVDVDDDDAGSR